MHDAVLLVSGCSLILVGNVACQRVQVVIHHLVTHHLVLLLHQAELPAAPSQALPTLRYACAGL